LSSDKRTLVSRIPAGSGIALDLGGGTGELRSPLERRGYAYVNLDTTPASDGRAVVGDAHRVPLATDSVDLVVSRDSLEHFTDPRQALREVRRVLKPTGSFVIWVPFMHPFHGNDYFRFTPLGLRLLMGEAGFRIDSLEAPVWVFSVVAQALIALLQRLRLGLVERRLEGAAAWLDARFRRFQGENAAFAAAYLVVATPDHEAPAEAEPR
jgi:SAM-dependent methyltransferase